MARAWVRLGTAVLLVSRLGTGGAAGPGNLAALIERLHRADLESALDADGLKPWHLKLTVQLYDAKGQPTAEQGNVEEWWAGDAAWRIVYTMPGYKAVEVKNAQALFRSKGGGTAPQEVKLLLDQVVHPMPSTSDVDESKPDLRKQDFGRVALDCIMLAQPIARLAYAPFGLFPTYCFDPGQTSLRITYDFGSQLIMRNAVGQFQARKVATDVTLFERGVRSASAKVVTLTTSAAEAGNFDKVEDLVAVPEQVAQVPGVVMAGEVLKKMTPIYPESARRSHVSGTVMLHAIIGREGHIHRLRLQSAPDPDLAVAAIAAVRQWTYKPYLLNGEPTEVDTTITVNFNFGP